MKQGKNGKKGKKSFFKSKKSLVAAALAALIALAGVTYAWFTWSVGLTGGTLKADYVQIDADFGVYVKINTLFKNYARYFVSNDSTKPPVVLKEVSPYYLDEKGIDDDAEIFIPFDYFQDLPDALANISDTDNLMEYLANTKYEARSPLPNTMGQYTDEALDGKSYLEILAGYRMSDGDEKSFYKPFFINGADSNVDPTEYKYAVSSVLFTDSKDNIFDVAKIFNRYVTHELPSNTLQVGYAIKNLGAACYISLPDVNKAARVSQATAGADYDAGVVFGDGTNYVKPAWGIAQYGNFIYGKDFDTEEDLGGWHQGADKDIYANGQFYITGSANPDLYRALYDTADDSIDVPKQKDLVTIVKQLATTGAIDDPEDYGLDLSDWNDLDLVRNQDFEFPLDVINKAYAYSAGAETFDDGKVGLYKKVNDYDIYPLSVTDKWEYDSSSEWEINLVDGNFGAYVEAAEYVKGIVAGGVIPSTLPEIDAEVADAIDNFNIGAIAEAYDLLYSPSEFVLVYENLALGYAAGTDKSIFAAVAYLIEMVSQYSSGVPSYAITDLFTVSTSLSTRTYDVQLYTDFDGFSVLHVQGPAFTYKTVDTAPTIKLKYTVKYGKYLDNRFVGSELRFANLGVVAVQNTTDAAYDVFVTHGNEDLDTANGGAVYGPEWFESINGFGIKISDINNLPVAYKYEITTP